jgi:2-polyprenyl-6-methoxyphenol hydroxylase-like FAD-dependent oxidoreductase
MGLTGGLLDAGALADVLMATIQDPVYSNGSLLDRYAQVRRDIFLKVVDPLTQANLRRLCEGDPETLHQTDPFLKKVVESDVEEKARMRRNAPPLAIDML